jgi:transcriptional regulator with XRE-family HTH domain
MNPAGILRRDDLTNKAFGQRLRKIRKEAGLCQSKLAVKLGYKSGAQISKLETGSLFNPRVSALRRLVELYQIDLHELIIGEPSKAIEKELKLLRSMREDIKKQLAFTRGSLRVLVKAEAVLEAADTNVESILKTFEAVENSEAQQGKL